MRGLWQAEAKQQVQPLDESLAVAVQEAVVSGPAEAFGQDVLEHEPEEVGPAERTRIDLAAALGVAKGHLAVFAGQDVLLRQYPAIEIAPQVEQGVLAVADPFAIDDPVARQVGLHRPALLLHRLEPLAAEDLRQRLLGEEKLPLLGAPAVVDGIDGPGGDDDVHVGVKVQGPAVGVKHHRCAELSPQCLVVHAELGQGLPSKLDQQIIGRALVGVDQGTQLERQGEGDQVVIDRQQLGPLSLQPLLDRLVLALGASTVAAREWEGIGVLAGVAMDCCRAARLGATAQDRR